MSKKIGYHPLTDLGDHMTITRELFRAAVITFCLIAFVLGAQMVGDIIRSVVVF